MINNIYPPDHLLRKWESLIVDEEENVDVVLCEAFQAGANQELEACVEWASCFNYDNYRYDEVLRDIRRRPKPPSLKEQALEALKHAPGPDYPNPVTLLTADEHALIRRAIESLPD